MSWEVLEHSWSDVSVCDELGNTLCTLSIAEIATEETEDYLHRRMMNLAKVFASVPEMVRDQNRYNWLKANAKEVLADEIYPESDIHHGCKYVFPELTSWKEFCGQIEIDEAIDIQMSRES